MSVKDVIETGALFVGMLVSLCVLVGFFAKYVALPWFREHIVNPVKETNRQVTVNGHVSPEPTLLDKVDHLQAQVNQIRSDSAVAARMYEGHIDRSSGEWGHVWDALETLRRHVGAPPFKRGPHHHD